jgi:acyl-CoA thioester hydrolase
MSGGEAMPGWFHTRRIVEFRDTDAAGIAHFSSYFFWMESAEHEFLRHVGLKVVDEEPADAAAIVADTVAPQKPSGASSEQDSHGGQLVVSWPRVSVACDYTAALRFGESVDIDVAVEKIGTASVTYRFRFHHGSLEVATGRVVAVRCLMRSGRKPLPIRISSHILDRLGPYRLPG